MSYMDVSFLLLKPKYDLNTVSVLFDQETVGVADGSAARTCIDVTQFSLAHRRRGRARSSANTTSRMKSGFLQRPEPLFSRRPRWAGGFYCILDSTRWPLRRKLISGEQVQVKHNFV